MNQRRIPKAGLVAAALLASGVGCSRSVPPGEQDSPSAAPAASVVPSGGVQIPLGGTGAPDWQPIRDGIQVRREGAGDRPVVRVEYDRAPQQAAGAALVLPPGLLAGVSALEIGLEGRTYGRLTVCLTDSHGTVWSWPAIRPQGAGDPPARLELSAIKPDPYQNRAPAAAPFDPASCTMLTVLDINGFMSPDRPACSWAITRLEGVKP